MTATLVGRLTGFRIPSRWNPAVRVLVFLVLLGPFMALVTQIVNNSLGPDPAEHLMHVTGEWVMRLMVLVLVATPLARNGWPRLARYRRMLGLYVWFYATLHLLIFAQVYIGWSAEVLLEELTERPYVMVGFAAWLILVPLGITSAHTIRRRMGRYWKLLHKLTYAVAVLGWLHLLWLSRSDLNDAVIYGFVFASLLGWRAWKEGTALVRGNT
ncbi:MAG: sulfoxide reductase heme-binding subunit YedZ [Pseudomonadales bacterium]|nr:sulfoxide reductase heme-binding subunit YedZ [Pseudomonadales bacterium]